MSPYILNKLKISKSFWLFCLAIFLFFSLSLTTLAMSNYNRTIYGLSLAGVKIGGLNKGQLQERLANEAAKFNRQILILTDSQKKWRLTPADFGISLNQPALTELVLSFGHNQILSSLTQQIKTVLSGYDLPIIYDVDSDKLETALALFSVLETPAKNATLKYDPQNDDFSIINAQAGLIIDSGKLINDIIHTFNQSNGTIQFTLIEEKPTVTETNIEQVILLAQELIANAPYFLQNNNAIWQIDKTDLAGWISAAPTENNIAGAKLTFDAQAIEDFLAPLAATINREPINAKLTSENNELKFAVLSQDGQKLNIEDSVAKISQSILVGNKNIDLIVDAIAPQISNQTTKELGLLALLAQGESNFAGSPNNRRANIKTGATKLNGFLIKPGQEFSFAQAIGDIDAQNGWLPELVIKDNQTIPEYGGGLCQVSTTIFRAAVKAGLKITERHPHAYPVHYYDPPGFDATVYPPSPDLKFINDTTKHLLLQNKIEGNKLIFEIYGTSDGREVKLKGPFITQKNPDGSLKTILTQEIWRDGQLAETNIFRSSYKSPSLFPTIKPTPTPTPTPILFPSPSITPTPSPSPSPITSPPTN